MKLRSVYFNLFCLVVFSVFSLASFSHTHAQITNDIPSAIEVDIAPQNPGPNTETSITIKNYSTDLDRATITWSLNNKQLQKAVGSTHFEFRTGPLGTPSVVTVVINTVSGRTIRKNITLRPSEVDLVWETSGYTPPFYRGKSIYVNQGFVTVVAIPNMVGINGKKLNSKNLVYKWSVDGEIKGSDSGYGKDSFVFQGGIVPQPTTISVEASSLTDGTRASASIELDPERPELLLYQDDPLYGIFYNRALLETFRLTDDEVTFLALPYFFSGKTPTVSSLSYVWSMNGTDLGDTAKKNRVTLRRSGQTESGSATISIGLENSRDILQGARHDLSISFEAKGKEVKF